MALKNFTQFTPYTVLSGTDIFVGYRGLDEIRSDLGSITDAISGLLIVKGFTPGASIGTVKKVNFRYTITTNSPKNAVSGTDDFGFVLSYTPTQVDVYRNGAYLINSLDFLATNSTQILNLSTLNVGDIVEVVTLSATLISLVQPATGTGDVNGTSFRYTVAPGNTIQPGNSIISGLDDFGATLNFTSPNFDVFLNGSHLVRDLDYDFYSGGSSITLNDVVANGDTVDVVSLLANNILQIAPISAYSGIQRIQAGKDISISNITGTGSVTLSAKPGIRDIKVPTWTDGGHVTGWSTVQQYLSSVASSNRFTQASAFSISLIDVPGGASGDYFQPVVAPNGFLYSFPDTFTRCVKIDPYNLTITTIGVPIINNTIQGGTLAPNGKIYGSTDSHSTGGLIDPSNDTVTTFTVPTGYPRAGGSFAGTAGGVLAPNGKIYIIPANYTIIVALDPDSLTVATFGAGITGQINGVLAPNGKIYMVPQASTAAMKIDPLSNTVTTYAAVPSTGKWGGVLAPNGKIYMIPNSSSVLVVVDPSNDSVATYGVPNPGARLGGVLAPNGKIYVPPYGGSSILSVIDPETNTITTINLGVANVNKISGCIAPNGRIFFGEQGNSKATVLNLLINNNFNLNICTNPMFNKL